LFVNNALDRFGFAFDGILTEDAGQDEVFERVALKPVLGALDGFNGTVFAYGQTGSGKTFTITGGVEKYAERGIVPRAISRLFSEIRKRVDSSTYEVTVTYVEVYNDQAYDLLCDYRDTNTAVGHTTTGGDQNLPAGSNAFGTGSTWTGAQKSFGTSTSGTNSGTAKNSSTTTPPSQSTSGGIDCAVSLPKVTLLEDDDGVVHARGCSVHRASSEEDALNLLFLGDVNRAVAETPMNLASSRSHCVFTMNVSRREVGSEVVRKGKVRVGAFAKARLPDCSYTTNTFLLQSKMHLVDLAGSERVEKTGAASDASTTREARHINLSLHALEKVVVALSDKTEHVPYRDSVMTMLLKDSLGGNCFTAMVATVSPTTRHVLESISTCRFAMRIKSVTNCLQVNEETDPRLVIKRLRLENKTLREEVKLLRGDNDGGRDTLTESEIAKVRNEVETFCGTSFGTSDTAAGTSNAATTSIDFGASLLKINAAMLVFKDMVLLARGSEAKNPVPNESDSKKETQRVSPSLETLRDETKRLAKVVSQRDDEIKVLVSLLDENKKSGGALTRPPGTTESYLPSTSLDRSEYRSSSGHDAETYLSSNALGRSAFTDSSTSLDRSAFSDKATAFVAFKARYPKRAAIEENKNVLRQKYAAAKSLGEVRPFPFTTLHLPVCAYETDTFCFYRIRT
jgi:kinesin family protein 6/9